MQRKFQIIISVLFLIMLLNITWATQKTDSLAREISLSDGEKKFF